MASAQISQQLKKLRNICLALPEAVEGTAHDRPIFCVGKEAFAAFEEHGGAPHIAVRIGPEDFRDRSRATRLLFKQHKVKEGWILFKIQGDIDWDEVKDLVLMSYVSVAPRKMLQALDRTLTTH